MKDRIYSIEIELLEDLHSGCGTGNAFVDRALARDAQGRVVIHRTHIKGVWHDNSQRLAHLGAVNEADVAALFGRPGSGADAGRLVCGSWRSTSDTLVWESTAREPGSRRPADHTLRSTEYLPAGTRLHGSIRIEDASETLIETFETIVAFTDRFGSERTRGSGLVRVVELKNEKPTSRETFPAFTNDKGPVGLRLLLRNPEPVCVPATGYPGNIIKSFSHIPGSALHGALCRWGLRHGIDVQPLFEHRLSVGDGNPLPSSVQPASASADLAQLQVLPIPLNLYRMRPAGGAATLWPHWADAEEELAPLSNTVYRDEVSEDPGDDSYVGAKRPPESAYLYAGQPGAWHEYRAPVELQMRNRRGAPMERVLNADLDLFTVEQIPAESLFVCDLHFAEPAQAQSFAREFTPLLVGAEVLRVGRGGAPVEVLSAQPLDVAHNYSDNAEAGILQLTLTSDLVARSPSLGFHRRLSGALVRRLAGDEETRITEEETFSSHVTLRSFNFVSGLPGAPFVAIGRGSVLRMTGENLGPLRRRLGEMTALGERAFCGNGRFRLDFYPLREAAAVEHTVAAIVSQSWNEDIDKLESILDQSSQYARSVSGKVPRPSQLYQLRNAVYAARSAESIKRVYSAFEEKQRKKGGRRWAALFPTSGIDKPSLPAAVDGLSPSQQRIFVSAVVRQLSRDKS